MCTVCCPSAGKRRISNRTCVYCLVTFKPKQRRYSTFCSPRCAARYYGELREAKPKEPKVPKVRTKWGPARKLLDKECPTCKQMFRPLGSEQEVCSMKCRVPWRKINLDRLRELVDLKTTTRMIADEFGVTTNACRKAIKQLKEKESKSI